MYIPHGNKNWSEKEHSGPYTYSNEFGEVELTPVTDFMPVNQISSGKLPVITDHLVSLDTAEQVVLITENRRMTMSPTWPLGPVDKACYCVKYSCVNRGAVCKVNVKTFKTPGGISAQQQIENMAPKTMGPLPVY